MNSCSDASDEDNATLYGKTLENREIVTTGVQTAKAPEKLLALLNRYSAAERTHNNSVRERHLSRRRIPAANGGVS
jgi:hypothetical protein